MFEIKDVKFGYLRESSKSKDIKGHDPAFGLNRTGLDDYLKVIFPDVNDWIFNKPIRGLITKEGKASKIVPDYRSESLKLVVEFDGLLHYQSPYGLINDLRRNEIYSYNGYKVVRIPYFIQLTNKVVERLFGVIVEEKLFNGSYPSLSSLDSNTPEFLCPSGIRRMVKEFKDISPEQFEVNKDYLMSDDPNKELSGIAYLITTAE